MHASFGEVSTGTSQEDPHGARGLAKPRASRPAAPHRRRQEAAAVTALVSDRVAIARCLLHLVAIGCHWSSCCSLLFLVVATAVSLAFVLVAAVVTLFSIWHFLFYCVGNLKMLLLFQRHIAGKVLQQHLLTDVAASCASQVHGLC